MDQFHKCPRQILTQRCVKLLYQPGRQGEPSKQDKHWGCPSCNSTGVPSPSLFESSGSGDTGKLNDVEINSKTMNSTINFILTRKIEIIGKIWEIPVNKNIICDNTANGTVYQAGLIKCLPKSRFYSLQILKIRNCEEQQRLSFLYARGRVY